MRAVFLYNIRIIAASNIIIESGTVIFSSLKQFTVSIFMCTNMSKLF